MKSPMLIVSGVVFAGVLLAGAFFIPWKNVEWGSVTMRPAKLVTVSGQAKSEEKTQVATYTAGVGSVNINKDAAVKEVNDKLAEIVKSIKTFGIAEADIRTQNLSIYQDQESYWDQSGQTQRTRPGQWRVNNTVEVKLRAVDRAAELSDLLASTGATNVWGPNFAMEDTKDAENALLKAAIDDARKKAETIAEASGKKLGTIVSVNEDGIVNSLYPTLKMADGFGGGGGAVVEPGSQTVTKTVTVTFELK